jgi:hypothetical protein
VNSKQMAESRAAISLQGINDTVDKSTVSYRSLRIMSQYQSRAEQSSQNILILVADFLLSDLLQQVC